MKIEIWSDFVCPFCYIGKRRLEEALQQFPARDSLQIVFKSYELDPGAKKDNQQPIHEMLAAKYGMSVEQAKKTNADIGRQAKAAGLDFQFDSMVPTNTMDAHRLAKFAEERGAAEFITERLLKSYFTENKNISDHYVLADIAEEAGLDRKEVLAMLESRKYREEVRRDEEEARQIGVKGVPFFVLNQKYAISGAQPVETFLSAIKKVWEEENSKPAFKNLSNDNAAGSFCTDKGCQ